MEETSMRAMCRGTYLVLCLALICGLSGIGEGSYHPRAKRITRHLPQTQHPSLGTSIGTSKAVPIGSGSQGVQAQISTSGAPMAQPAATEEIPAPQALKKEKLQPALRSEIERFAPFIAVGCSLIVLLVVLWLSWKIARELRRIRAAAGISARGAVELVGSVELEPGLQAYFVRVEGKMLALTTDIRRGGIAAAVVTDVEESSQG